MSQYVYPLHSRDGRCHADKRDGEVRDRPLSQRRRQTARLNESPVLLILDELEDLHLMFESACLARKSHLPLRRGWRS